MKIRIIRKIATTIVILLAVVMLTPLTAQADPAVVWHLRGDENHCTVAAPYWVDKANGVWALTDIPGEFLQAVENKNIYIGRCNGYVPLGEIWEGKQIMTLDEFCTYTPYQECNSNGSFVLDGSEGGYCYISHLDIITTDMLYTIASSG